MRKRYSPPRRGGVARQLNRSWRAGVVSSANRFGRSSMRLRPIGLALRATPSAPHHPAHPPLVCEEEGNIKS